MIACPNCNAQNQDAAEVCFNCRAALLRPAAAPVYAAPSSYAIVPAGYPAPGAVPLGPPTSSSATMSLIFGILGLAGVLPLIGSIVAIFTARSALREIAARPGQVGGADSARIGQILGYIGLGIWGFFALVFLVPMVCFCLWFVFVIGLAGVGAALPPTPG